MNVETVAIAIGSVLLGLVLAYAIWKLVKGAIVIAVVLLLGIALYAGSFVAVSHLEDGDHAVRTRSFLHPTLVHLYAPLRWLDILRFGKDGIVWR